MATVCLQGGNELLPASIPMDSALLARAPAGRVVVVPLASKPGADYARTGTHASRYFAEIGVDAVVAPDARRDAAGAVDAVETAGLVFLTGGSPRVLRDALRDTGLGDVVRARVDAGALVVGSSAGAMVACATTLLPQWRSAPLVGPGLGLIDDIVVVPHFDGGRTQWVRVALSAAPTVLGIPENSGVVIDTVDGKMVAIGVAPTTVITRDGRRHQLVAGVGFEPT